MFTPEHSTIAYVVGIVLLGSLANAMVALNKARQESLVYNIVDFTISIIVSMFAGMMFGLAAMYFSEDPIVMSCSAGVGAYLGVGGLAKLTDMFFNAVESYIKNRGGHGK